jgi:hypothetical protein
MSEKSSPSTKSTTAPTSAQPDRDLHGVRRVHELIRVALTIAERDAIDVAKSRIRRLAVLVSQLLDSNEELLSDDDSLRPAG